MRYLYVALDSLKEAGRETREYISSSVKYILKLISFSLAQRTKDLIIYNLHNALCFQSVITPYCIQNNLFLFYY